MFIFTLSPVGLARKLQSDYTSVLGANSAQGRSLRTGHWNFRFSDLQWHPGTDLQDGSHPFQSTLPCSALSQYNC